MDDFQLNMTEEQAKVLLNIMEEQDPWSYRSELLDDLVISLETQLGEG